MTTSPITSISDELLAELEAAAKAATQGDWEVDGCEVGPTWDSNASIAKCSKREDAAFIADANPTTILALLAERAELKRDAATMRSALERLARVPGCGCSFPCRCGGEEWTKAELEGRMDVAAAALAAMQEAKP